MNKAYKEDLNICEHNTYDRDNILNEEKKVCLIWTHTHALRHWESERKKGETLSNFVREFFLFVKKIDFHILMWLGIETGIGS